MNIEVQQHGSVTVMAPRGPLAADDSETFRQKLAELTSKRRGRVVLDLREVPFVDGAGIEALVELCAAGLSPTHPRLAGLGDTCREALDLTDALGQFEIFDTVESAIRSLKE